MSKHFKPIMRNFSQGNYRTLEKKNVYFITMHHFKAVLLHDTSMNVARFQFGVVEQIIK